jgi:putative ABC transport system permease protein
MLREFLADLKAQKLRTALTILGITWGTVAVIVLLAFGVGLEAQTRKRFHGLGERIVLLFGGRTTRSYAGFGEGRYIKLREEDAAVLAREIPDIVQISPEYTKRAPVRHGVQAANPTITGVYPVYEDLRNEVVDTGGRFINDLDLSERRRVAVLGAELKTLLFGSDPAIGRRVFLGEVPFLVIGILVHKEQNSSYSSRDKDRIFIPASTHHSVFGQDNINDIIYRTRDARITKNVEHAAYEALGRKYRFDPTDKDALSIWDTADWETRFGYLFLAFDIFFALVGSFTLTVGGIGVANIMYIVVKERTREIGIKRSIGARRRDILLQFFAESFLIVAVGAALGFLFSTAIVWGMSFIPIKDFVGTPQISPLVAGTTMALLAGIGFMAGLFPARKAANLDPVECLRY